MEGENILEISNFPLHIIEDILSRVSVESLLQLRYVCKSWRSLIDSEEFIKIQLKKSRDNELYSHHRILLTPGDRVVRIFNWTTFLEDPIPNPFQHDYIVCLIRRGRFILWNPATRMSLDLPDAESRPFTIMGIKFSMYGFGYDESGDDYKVFTVITSHPFVKRPPFCRVYSLKSYSWKTLEDQDCPSCGGGGGVFVSGNLHWFGEGEIVSFDLKNEAFGVVQLPNYSGQGHITTTLGVMEGCLSVLCDYPNSHFHGWVMKEYGVKQSWVNLYTLSHNNHPPLRTLSVSSFFGGPNGEVLLKYPSSLVMYSHYTDYDDALHTSFVLNIGPIMGEGMYVESLVSLGPNAEKESI